MCVCVLGPKCPKKYHELQFSQILAQSQDGAYTIEFGVKLRYFYVNNREEDKTAIRRFGRFAV